MHAISSYHVIRPKNTPTNTHMNKQTDRQDRLQYTAPLSLACSVITSAAAAYISHIGRPITQQWNAWYFYIRTLITRNIRSWAAVSINSFLHASGSTTSTVQQRHLSTHWLIINVSNEKALGEMQTQRAGRSNAEPKIFAPPQTPFPGAQDGQNLISWRWCTTCTYRPSLVNFELLWWHRPPATNTLTGPITIHCAAS